MTRSTSSGRLPRYRALAAMLRDQILSGHVPANARIPSETQLAARCKVSRVTARQAIQILEKEELVRRIRGSGTFVNRRGFGNRPLTTLRHACLLRIDVAPAPGYYLKGIEAGEQWLRGRDAILSTIHMTGPQACAPGAISQAMISRGAQGLIVDGILTETHAQIISHLGLPYVIAGNVAISRSYPQIRFAVGTMVRRAVSMLKNRFPNLPIVMAVDASVYQFRKEALAAYRQVIRACKQGRPLVVHWRGDIDQKLRELAASAGRRFAVIAPERALEPLFKYYRAMRVAQADQMIVQIASPEMVPQHERATRFFIPTSGERITTAALQVLVELVEKGQAKHYQEIDAEIEPPTNPPG